MIQELFGGSATELLNRDRNLPISGVLETSPSHSPSPSSSTTTTTTNSTTSDTQKLRCPRCDSSHTKFCYYNNYNLTQPRYFCKTCRRYWTKGGALRNVPIGGGCRKNKGATITTAIRNPISATGKLKCMVASELGKSGFMNGFELEPIQNPTMWSGPTQTSHLLSLFRPTQNPNPNPNPSFALNAITHNKDQNFMIGSNMGSLGFDQPVGQTPSLGLCSSLWRTNQDHQNHHEQHDQLGLKSSNPASYYQHDQLGLRSSNLANYYQHDQNAPLILGSNVANNSSSTSSSSTILDSAPVLASGEVGFWNQTLPWSDLAAANGAYP